MIMSSYVKWREVPIVTSTDEFLTSVSDIPFPAITICLESKSNLKEFDYYEKLKEFEVNPRSITNDECANC